MAPTGQLRAMFTSSSSARSAAAAWGRHFVVVGGEGLRGRRTQLPVLMQVSGSTLTV